MSGGAFDPLFNIAAQHHAAPPYKQAMTRAELGTALLVLSVYGWLYAKGLTGFSAEELAAVFMRSPANPPRAVWLPLSIWGGMTLLGSVWLISGISGARGGPRSGMAIFWSLVRLSLCGGVTWWAESAPADWQAWVWFLDRGLIVLMVSDGVCLLLELRSGGRAKQLVLQQIEDAEIPWRPASRG